MDGLASVTSIVGLCPEQSPEFYAALRRKRVLADRVRWECNHVGKTCRSFALGCPCACEVCTDIRSMRPEGVV